MAVTNFSPLLGLALPTTGDLSGTWGTTVNDSITNLLDTAVAGTTTLSTDGDVTLSTTNGAANQARSAVLLCTGARTVLRTITAPAQSKAYVVINQTTGGFGVKVVGAGPTTGVTIANGDKALIAWNGSDFVVVSSTSISNLTGTLPVTSGGTGQTTYTDGQLLIGNTTGNTLTKATLTAGSGISVTNGSGSITIAATGGNGTVTSVNTSNGPAPINGLTLTGGPITTSGTVTLGGGVNVSTITTGTLPVANGGTGQTTYTNGQLLIGNSTGNTLTKATLTAGTGISITNGAGSVTVAATATGSNIQTFTAGGTYTKPTGANFVMVELWGAGGGGNSSPRAGTQGGGGGGGAYTYRMFAAPQVGATESVTVGAGGPAGSNGGTTNFGTLLYAYGGTGGGVGTGGNGGSIVSSLITEVAPFGSPSPANGSQNMFVNLAGRANNGPGGSMFNLSVWGGGQGSGAGNIPGGGSFFGGGGGGSGGNPFPPNSPAPAAATGGAGGVRIFGSATTFVPQGPSSFNVGAGGGGTGGSPGGAGTPGGDFSGGGGGGASGGPNSGLTGGDGGLAAGGGGAGGSWNSSPPGPANAGGNGGNGYVVVYTW